MNAGQLISGGVLVVFGAVLIVLGLFYGFGGGNIMFWIYGVVLLIIGLAVLLNRREDKIEQIKSTGRKK